MPIDKEYLLQYCKENNYPEEACATLLEMLGTLSVNEKAVSVFRQQELLYRRDLSTDFEGMIRRITLLAEELELDVRIVHQLFLICLTPALHEKHQKAGLPEELYDKIQWDVYRKLMECHEVHGVWGTVTATWNTRAFQLTRFQLGRLQFEPIYAYASYENGELSVKEGDTVINIHIPSGLPLTREACKDSLKQAYAWFSPLFGDKPVVLFCASWLLSPDHREMLPPQSNIIGFLDLFRPVAGDRTVENNLWRIFGQMDCSDIATLPRKTSLQRIYADTLAQGKMPRSGMGFIFMKDGEII